MRSGISCSTTSAFATSCAGSCSTADRGVGVADGVVQRRVISALRRTIIGEAARFPDLARTWWEHGPAAGHETLARLFQRASDEGRLRRLEDPMVAAQHFNWLVLSIPLNAAMFLGNEAVPSRRRLHAIADEAVRVFLAAYGP